MIKNCIDSCVEKFKAAVPPEKRGLVLCAAVALFVILSLATCG